MKVEIEENKLIIVGELMKSTEAESRVLVPGKKHVFFCLQMFSTGVGIRVSVKNVFWSNQKKGLEQITRG